MGYFIFKTIFSFDLLHGCVLSGGEAHDISFLHYRLVTWLLIKMKNFSVFSEFIINSNLYIFLLTPIYKCI